MELNFYLKVTLLDQVAKFDDQKNIEVKYGNKYIKTLKRTVFGALLLTTDNDKKV